MDSAEFNELQAILKQDGPEAAIDRLIAVLKERKDYSSLFYALLVKKRYQLGVSPIPTGPAQDLPDEVHCPYEEAIREAGRLVGRLFLEEGNIPSAWMYYRMLGEHEPVNLALETAKPGEGEDVQQLVDIAYHQGVNPKRGFDLVLDRFGICSAITLVSGHEFPHGQTVRQHCIKRLARTLYRELAERLKADIIRKEGTAPDSESVQELIEGRDYLFEDEFYHIDVSHLGAVVQMATHLPSGPELNMARELCAYGRKLSPRFQYPGEPPFEDQYKDYGIYLDTLAGENIERGVAHFRCKAETADPDQSGTRPAEVLVNLLLRLDRPQEALAASRQFLSDVDPRMITCPDLNQLCQLAGDYQTMANVAREHNDPVHYLAGLLLASRPAKCQ